MNVDIIHHYPPEILNLLVDTIPLLCRSKKGVLIFFRGAGVADSVTADFRHKVERDPGSVSKYDIAREVLVRLNDKGEASLRERREIIKRVIEFEDFSTCWPDDQLKAKGLVAEIRRVVEVKDAFGRMRQEKDAERRHRLDEEAKKLAVLKERKEKRAQVKKELFALFGEPDRQKRGKQLEQVLNRLFLNEDILVREAFSRVGTEGEGVVEQIDGVIELDGEIYLVEMKWWEKPLGTSEVSPHLVRVYARHGARGVLISYSGFTAPGVATFRDALVQRVVVLTELQEIVQLLEGEHKLSDLFREKVRAAVVDKNPLHRLGQVE